jgi:Putative Ig domain
MAWKGFGSGTGTLPAYVLAIAMLFVLTGCKFDDEKTANPATPTTGTGGSGGSGSSGGGGTPATTNRAPQISGKPVNSAKVSQPYSFQPQARDPDGDKLTFQVRGKPDWTTFDTRTGRLAGTPPAGSTGTYTGVQITVTDGAHTVEMAPFSISVQEPTVGVAELVWDAPAANEDGTPLTDLSGYVIRYGRNAGALDQSIRIPNPGTTMYVVEQLDEGTWYFSLSAVNGDGVESRPTGYVSTTIG